MLPAYPFPKTWHSSGHKISSLSGWVQVNQGLGQSPGHSYGGYKESGIGREFSLEGMLESYAQRKNVTVERLACTPVRRPQKMSLPMHIV